MAGFEREVTKRVDAALRGHDPEVVHTALVEELQRRLPGVDVDDGYLRAIAMSIADGTFSEGR